MTAAEWDALPKADHSIFPQIIASRIEASLDMAFTCHGNDGSRCHHVPDCECDSPCEHTPKPYDRCAFLEYIENDGWEIFYDGLNAPLMPGPIEFAWGNHSPVWWFMGQQRATVMGEAQ